MQNFNENIFKNNGECFGVRMRNICRRGWGGEKPERTTDIIFSRNGATPQTTFILPFGLFLFGKKRFHESLNFSCRLRLLNYEGREVATYFSNEKHFEKKLFGLI